MIFKMLILFKKHNNGSGEYVTKKSGRIRYYRKIEQMWRKEGLKEDYKSKKNFACLEEFYTLRFTFYSCIIHL